MSAVHRRRGNRPEVAYFSPLPPERSGVADYSAQLLPALGRRVDVRVVRRGGDAHGSAVRLYHLGNDPNAHGWIMQALDRRPGIVVLHEVALHELFASLMLGRGDTEGYLDAVQRDGGERAGRLARRYLAGLAPPIWEARPLEVPLISDVLERAEAVIVHSRFAEERVRVAGYSGLIRRVPMPAPPSNGGVATNRADVSPVVCSAGIVNWTKRIPQLLEAFALLRKRLGRAALVLVGPGARSLNLDARLERLGLRRGRDVIDLGYVDERRLTEVLATSTVSVSLRWPTLGETSASVVRTLAAGCPAVVTDTGWFSELPSEVAVKVPRGGELEIEHLASVLERLCSDRGLRSSMGAAARAYAREHHDVEATADGYASVIQQVGE